MICCHAPATSLPSRQPRRQPGPYEPPIAGWIARLHQGGCAGAPSAGAKGAGAYSHVEGRHALPVAAATFIAGYA